MLDACAPSTAPPPHASGSSSADFYLFALFWVVRGPPGRFARPRRLGPCAVVAVGGGAFVRGARRGVVARGSRRGGVVS
eukprot:8088221-Alexandrium_andersonii.AAC.1